MCPPCPSILLVSEVCSLAILAGVLMLPNLFLLLLYPQVFPSSILVHSFLLEKIIYYCNLKEKYCGLWLLSTGYFLCYVLKIFEYFLKMLCLLRLPWNPQFVFYSQSFPGITSFPLAGRFHLRSVGYMYPRITINTEQHTHG